MRPALLIGAGLTALVALAGPAHAAAAQPCEARLSAETAAPPAPCHTAPCDWAAETPCGR
jgi:hypothetical protein